MRSMPPMPICRSYQEGTVSPKNNFCPFNLVLNYFCQETIYSQKTIVCVIASAVPDREVRYCVCLCWQECHVRRMS